MNTDMKAKLRTSVKVNILQMRLSDEEYEYVFRQAEANGLPASTYVRMVIHTLMEGQKTS